MTTNQVKTNSCTVKRLGDFSSSTIGEKNTTKRDVIDTPYKNQSVGLTKKQKSCCPWLRGDGTEKNDDELKLSVKSWGGKDWDDYITYLDKKDGEMREHLVPPEKLDFLGHENYSRALADMYDSDEYASLRGMINRLLEKLTERQLAIVKLRYWENMKLHEIAGKLDLSESSVRTHLRRAEKNLKKSLQNYRLNNHVAMNLE